MMEFPITSMTPEERMYAYSQSSQIEGQTGCIGHLRGDFGAGKEFYTSWFDHQKEYKDDEFKAEFDEVVNTLREKDGLLCSRDSMNRFCYQHPEAEFEGNYCTESTACIPRWHSLFPLHWHAVHLRFYLAAV